MIIICNKCNKNFTVDDNLIPKNGRLLECGNCKNRWYFKPEVTEKNHENENMKNVNYDLGIINDNIEIPKEQNSYKKEIIKPKKITSKNILRNLIVFLISLVAIIIVFDTFKETISIILPGLIPLLENLYATLYDLLLFFKDLLK